LGERCIHIAEVTGSRPVSPTNSNPENEADPAAADACQQAATEAKRMKPLYQLALMLLLAVTAQAGELLSSVELESANDEGIVTVTAVPGKQQHLLLDMDEPPLTSSLYAFRGMIRYEGVEGTAHLHLNNDFGDYGSFFTKSMAADGPLRTITGDSGWREFVMPFNADNDRMALLPERLTLTLVLPGAGTVYIRNVGLYQYTKGEDPLEQTD
jgi:hypothetical protein